MNPNLKANIIFWIHTFLTIVMLISPLLVPKRYLIFIIFYYIILILHWKIFGGCILSIVEKQLKNEKYKLEYKDGFLDRLIIKIFGLQLEEDKLRTINFMSTLFPLLVSVYRYTNLYGLNLGYIVLYIFVNNFIM